MHVDFETFSLAGYQYNEATKRWTGSEPLSPKKSGIELVGADNYARHPSTEVLCLSYGDRLWFPGLPAPVDLFQYIATGEPLHAWNSMFEYLIWLHVCHRRMGWPAVPLHQFRDTAAQSRARGFPGGLEQAGDAIDAPVKKLKAGAALLKKFSMPRNPTERDPRFRITPEQAPADAAALYHYCMTDVAAERCISGMLPELPPDELDLWKLDQTINERGVGVDREGLEACIRISRETVTALSLELQGLTGGAVSGASELDRMGAWFAGRGFPVQSLDADALKAFLKRNDLPADVRRVAELRDQLSMSSTAKLPTIRAQLSPDDRLRGMFVYHGAGTGRWTGRGAQPQNLPAGGPPVKRCGHCRAFVAEAHTTCPVCGSGTLQKAEWAPEAVEQALGVFKSGGYSEAARIYGDPLWAVSGCLRGLFVAGHGMELLSSDFSAIEAVVLAALAGESWRLEVFHSHGLIYEMSASKISGVPFQTFLDHKGRTGEHHPLRKTIGKVAELASGYGGGWSAWCNFGADKFMTEADGKAAIQKWREESPAIVSMWYGLEDSARLAIENPGSVFRFRELSYIFTGGALRCRLPSGRILVYNSARLVPDVTPWGKPIKKIVYYRVDPETFRWGPVDTWGGKLTENVVQAVSRDLLTHAMRNVEAAGFPIVLHVHDELVAEVPAGFGSVERFEELMRDVPPWAAGWPVRAAGGWRGRRYRKG